MIAAAGIPVSGPCQVPTSQNAAARTFGPHGATFWESRFVHNAVLQGFAPLRPEM